MYIVSQLEIENHSFNRSRVLIVSWQFLLNPTWSSRTSAWSTRTIQGGPTKVKPTYNFAGNIWMCRKIQWFLADRTIGRALWHGVVCLSVCLSSSVTFCIVAKRYVLAKKCLKEWIGNQGQKVHFFGSPPYFYFQFCRYGHRDGRFCLIFARTAKQSLLVLWMWR